VFACFESQPLGATTISPSLFLETFSRKSLQVGLFSFERKKDEGGGGEKKQGYATPPLVERKIYFHFPQNELIVEECFY
jgi:hypothetical protein